MLVQRSVLNFLIRSDIQGENYRKELIPVGLGLVIWIVTMVYVALWSIAEIFGLRIDSFISLQEYGLILTIVFFAGWLDDTVGERQIKGLRGHFRAWLKERTITTGLLKVGMVSSSALWIVIRLQAGWGIAIIQFFTIILMTNAMNLLDLRPGRTLKAFIALAISLLLAAPALCWLYIAPLLIGSGIIFWNDLRAKAMLGDMGANILGFALGVAAAVSLSLLWLIVLLAMLVMMHWIAERSSISQLIAHNRLLSWLDRLGR